MDTEYEKSRIERQKRGLYRVDADKDTPRDIPRLSKTKSTSDVDDNWSDNVLTHHPLYEDKKSTTRLLKIFVLLALFAALFSGGYVLYQFFDPLDKPSDKNVLITLETPVAITPGSPVDIVVRIANQNRVALQYANLSVVFPVGTRASDNPDKDFRDQKKILGVIAAGDTVELRTKAIFLGEENEEKNIRALLEYRFDGMNSTFTKESARPIRMLSAPVNLTVNMLKEVNAGQETNMSISATSNTGIPLRDMFIKVEYPLGFTFVSAEPKPTFGNNIWRLGTLSPGGKFPIKVVGVLDGTDSEKRVFRTLVGVGGDKTEREISTLYGVAINEISVARPFIGIALSINGKPAGDALAQYGQVIRGEIEWKNNLATRISNAQIEVRLSGVVLDRSSVTSGQGGYYRSLDNTISWDERGSADLGLIESGQTGFVGFSFKPLPSITGNQLITNPVITAEVTVRGRRMSDANVPEEIKTVSAQNVRIASEVQFAARSLYYSGPFVNSGPVPPRVEKETTYTVIWSIVNTSNNITGARVRATLPPFIKWYGSISPSKENLTYNKSANEIVWIPGEIPAGTGISTPPKEVAFQLVLLPSLTQVGMLLPLLSGQVFSATDSFANSEITISGKDVETDLPTDPRAGTLVGKVAP